MKDFEPTINATTSWDYAGELRQTHTTDGNIQRIDSDRLGISNMPEQRSIPMSPGREISIQEATRKQQVAWNTRFE